MAKEQIPFEDFLLTVGPENQGFVSVLHEELVAAGCRLKIESAKSGYVVSYQDPALGRALLNYVTRKKGTILRLYADHVAAYEGLVDELPAALRAGIKKAGPCRRMLDPAKCNSRCPMGYVFTLEGEQQKKCRYNAFMLLLGAENNAPIKALVQKELAHRTA